MKLLSLTISALIGAAFGAPAIVWNNGKHNSVVHSSEEVKASVIISELVANFDDNSSLDAAVFVVAKSPEGVESLSKLTSSGALPLVASKYNEASTVHSHAAGIKTAGDVVRETGKESGKKVLEVTLAEFHTKMSSLGNSHATETEVDEKATKRAINRAKSLARANILVVNVPASTDPSTIDQAVVKAVEHNFVSSVVLVGQRSNGEVRLERDAEKSRKLAKMQQRKRENRGRSRRRLEENDANAADDGGNSNDNTLEYYVPMTPNIFAGIIFTLFFGVVVFTGLSCMNMIQGQDVYVKKLPSIGREA